MRAVALLSLVLIVVAGGGCGGVSNSSCGVGLSPCGGVCTDRTIDNNNCGVCGNVCGLDRVCSAGQCIASSHLGQPGGGVPANAPVYRILPGAGTVIQPGTQAGYGITANVGGSYRLVWTGDGNQSGSYREFWGSVYTGGRFTSITPGCAGGACTFGADDTVNNPVAAPGGGQRVDFDSFAASGINGFDFVIDAEPVTFDMFIDGVRYPMLVFFPATDNGGRVSNVERLPFGLTTQ